MPPHCDALDGPVATAARKALEAGDVDLVLPYVRPDGEEEVTEAFALACAARETGGAATVVAERWFIETVVRVHRAGEGAAYTGVKPAGLDVGPVLPLAERAVDSGEPDAWINFLTMTVRDEAWARFARAMVLRPDPAAGVAEVREYVRVVLDLEVWSHRLYETARADGTHEG